MCQFHLLQGGGRQRYQNHQGNYPRQGYCNPLDWRSRPRLLVVREDYYFFLALLLVALDHWRWYAPAGTRALLMVLRH